MRVLGNKESRWIDKRILLRGEFFSNCFLFCRNDAFVENMFYGVIDEIYFTEMFYLSHGKGALSWLWSVSLRFNIYLYVYLYLQIESGLNERPFKVYILFTVWPEKIVYRDDIVRCPFKYVLLLQVGESSEFVFDESLN